MSNRTPQSSAARAHAYRATRCAPGGSASRLPAAIAPTNSSGSGFTRPSSGCSLGYLYPAIMDNGDGAELATGGVMSAQQASLHLRMVLPSYPWTQALEE